jgi:quercetin dioxygenase-like cupin family protein
MNEPALRAITANDEESREFGGILVTRKVHSSDTAGVYAILEFVVPPGRGAPQLHRHPVHETYQLLEGTYEFSTIRGGEHVSVHAIAPAIVHIPAGVWHTFRNAGATPARHQIVMAPGSFEDFFLELSQPVTEAPEGRAGTTLPIERFIEVGNKHGVEWLGGT